MDHVKFGVSEHAARKLFSLNALEPLDLTAGEEGSPAYSVELCTKAKGLLCLFQTDEKAAHLHLAFVAESRQQVDDFHHAAFVIGSDGHNIEAVCHEPDA